MRILLLGNAGAGKSTLARRLIAGGNVARLALDEIAWDGGTQRKPLDESRALLLAFIRTHRHWVIEGCYGDLVETALPYCDELIFLNPGVDTCIDHCRRRPWEAEKFASAAEQQAMLDKLIQWIGDYPTRQDEYGLARHRALFEGFTGRKRECQSPYDYPSSPAE
ncbi:hypothetical protein [Pseudomonas sp. PL-6]